jgi:hypothetical protein
MIFIVAGMHKSGTTLISRMLHASGISMIEESPHTGGYDDGIVYERRDAVRLNRLLLAGCFYPSPLAPIRSAVRAMRRRKIRPIGHASRSLVRRTPKTQTNEQRIQMRHFIDACCKHYTDWGFKDPRTCLTYALWRRELPSHKFVLVYRSYHEVLAHYRLTGWRRVNLPRLFSVLHNWVVYNSTILESLDNARTPCIVVNYECLMHDDHELRRLSSFIGRTLVDVRARDLYRRRHPLPKPTSISHWLRRQLPDDPVEVLQALERRRMA